MSKAFDHLPHPARMRAIATHTRSLDEAAYRAAHAALDSGTPDDRVLALFLATVRRDLDAVADALADPLLRRHALSAAIRLPVPGQALEKLILDGPVAVRRNTYGVLRLSRRYALADRLVGEVHARHGDEDTARLLAACTPKTVRQWLGRLTRVPATVLHALARRAPGPVAEHLAGPGAPDRGSLPKGRAVTTLSRQAAVRLVTEAAARCLPAERWAARLRELTAHGRPEVTEAALVAELRRQG